MSIRHTVSFRLKHAVGSDDERAFLDDVLVLGTLAGVENFERFAQVSAKNTMTYALSMDFADQDSYTAYDQHPVHVAFVRDRWVPEVSEFLEADFVQLS